MKQKLLVDSCPWNSPGQNTGVGSISLLQQIFLTQESNQDLLHCRQILYHLSHQGSPGVIILWTTFISVFWNVGFQAHFIGKDSVNIIVDFFSLPLQLLPFF